MFDANVPELIELSDADLDVVAGGTNPVANNLLSPPVIAGIVQLNLNILSIGSPDQENSFFAVQNSAFNGGANAGG